jgi:hypothetical protein
VDSGGGKEVDIPYGALTHRQGNHWGYITQEELAKSDPKKEIIWLKEGEIPRGIYKYAEGKGSAYKTLQILPQGAKLPTDKAVVDMGWATINITQEDSGELKMDYAGGKEAADDRWAEEKLSGDYVESPADKEKYQGLFMQLVVKANDNGYKIKYVSHEQLSDYAAMHPLMAKTIGYDMPENEIHLNTEWNDTYKDRYENLRHELEEMGEMQGGDNYWEAHNEALESEDETDVEKVKMPSPTENYDEYINDIIGKARTKNQNKMSKVLENRVETEEDNLVLIPEHYRRKRIPQSKETTGNDNIKLRTKKYLGYSLRPSSVGLNI